MKVTNTITENTGKYSTIIRALVVVFIHVRALTINTLRINSGQHTQFIHSRIDYVQTLRKLTEMSATPAKAKKVAKPKKPAAHPKYSDMIAKAVTALKERKGSSRQAILNYIMKNFNVGKDAKAVNSRLKVALKRGVVKGALKQSKGTGASGSFKLGEKKAAPTKAVKAKKPKAKSPKKKAAKKPAGEKKVAKKAAKPKKAKSPKKAAKPKKAKTPKKPAAKKASKPKTKAKKSPKKAAKKAAKKWNVVKDYELAVWRHEHLLVYSVYMYILIITRQFIHWSETFLLKGSYEVSRWNYRISYIQDVFDKRQNDLGWWLRSILPTGLLVFHTTRAITRTGVTGSRLVCSNIVRELCRKCFVRTWDSTGVRDLFLKMQQDSFP